VDGWEPCGCGARCCKESFLSVLACECARGGGANKDAGSVLDGAPGETILAGEVVGSLPTRAVGLPLDHEARAAVQTHHTKGGARDGHVEMRLDVQGHGKAGWAVAYACRQPLRRHKKIGGEVVGLTLNGVDAGSSPM